MATRIEAKSANNRRTRTRAALPHSTAINVAALRKKFGMTRRDFARMVGFSERAVASWEAGHALSEPGRRRMLEIRRLYRKLAYLVEEQALPAWFQSPNKGFQGLKPMEVLERGQIDRLWRMIYFLESGTHV